MVEMSSYFKTILLSNYCKVIPQYCTAPPVLRIMTRNWQQNIVTAFLAFLCTRKKWAFWKGMVGKNGWKFVASKEKKAEPKC